MTATYAKLNGAMLGDRIDATYYRPEYIANELRLRESGLDVVPLSSLVTSGRRAVYFDTSTLEDTAAPSDWLPFLTADDFGADGFFLNLNARRRVSPVFGSRYPNGRLRANELLVKVKCPNQITAYNEREPDRVVLVSGTIWGALVRRESVDPHYLVAALSSAYAATARTRLRTNLNVEFLSPTDLMLLDLPLPRSSDAQNYIGDKVRQAELLRWSAENSEQAFERAVVGSYPELNRQHSGSAKHNRAPASLLNGLLNPGEFNPDRMMVREYLRKNGGKPVADVAQIETPVSTDYGPNDAYIGLDSIGSSSGTIAPSTIAKEEVVGAVRTLPEGPVISKLRPYLNKVAYIPRELSGSLGSTELLCVRPNDTLLGWYLYGVLKLTSTVRQLNPVSTGSTHPRVSREDVAAVLIPWIDDASSFGTLLQKAQFNAIHSGRLTSVAKLLVEALIEGKITEDELVDAQQALERGDQTLDRSILSRMTEDGINVAGQPRLFADLDALYAAIDEAQRTQPSNGDAA